MTSGTSVTEVLAAVGAAVDGALAVVPWQLADADVMALVTGLVREESRLAAARGRILAEAEQRRVGQASGFLSVPGWYAATTRTRVREAGPTVALATAMTGPSATLGATADALAAGAITEAHAGVVHRVVEKVAAALSPRLGAPSQTVEEVAAVEATVADAQAFLVEHATRLDPDQLAVAGRHLVARLADPDDVDAAAAAQERALAAVGLTLVQACDGTWSLRAFLDPIGGATLAAALDAASAPLPAGADGAGGGRDLRTRSQRRAAGIVHIADHALGGHSTAEGGAPSATGSPVTRSRARLTVTVDARTLVNPWAHGASPGELTVPGCGNRYAGHPLAPSALEALACDAEIVPVLLGVDGAPLDVGRARYTFPEKIRAAIIARDGGCTLPHGCGRPPEWCQIHHLVSWSGGGVTSERNGALACTPGHHFVHRMGWEGRLEGDRVIWSAPDRASRRSSHPIGGASELQHPPPWKPGLDQLIAAWRNRLRAAAPRELRDAG